MSHITYDYYTLILHATQPRILLLSDANGWNLPHFELSERHFWQAVGHVNRAMRDQLGIDVTTLHCLSTDYHSQTKRVSRIYEMENHNSAWVTPAEGGWIGRDELNELPLTVPQHRALLETWFAEIEKGYTSRRPWAQRGWLKTAETWIAAQLGRLGLTANGPIEQARTWERSCVLTVRTTVGNLYFKAVPTIFAHEPLLTQALSAKFPAHLPKVLAIDTEQRWLLMQEMGKVTLDKVPDIARWKEALRAFAQIQVELAEQTDSLRALGCPERRLDQLAAGIDPLFADTPALLADQPAGLSEMEIEKLRTMAPRLKAMCAELARCGVPYSLEHGDFHPSQILPSDDTYVFIDWSDSSISHPFFSCEFLSESDDLASCLSKVTDAYTQLRDAYLEPWIIYAPMDRLIRAFELSQLLAALHHALIYHRFILPNFEAKWEMQNMLPFYLKLLVDPKSSNKQ